jgi:hypothetical protein
MDDSLRELLTEHLPTPPPEMSEPPLAAIRRRARRRTGAQMAMVCAAVAVIATGTVVVVGDDGTAATGGAGRTDSPTVTSALTSMLYPTYLPPGYREDASGDHGSELRYINPAADPPIPLVVRRLPEDARIPAEGPLLASATVRGRAADVLPIGNGGLTLTWLENGSRFSVSFEVSPNMQVDFVIEHAVDMLVSVADGLRSRR